MQKEEANNTKALLSIKNHMKNNAKIEDIKLTTENELRSGKSEYLNLYNY
jgi:hypothetical protein